MAGLRPLFPAHSLILGLDFAANSMSAEVALDYATEKQARSGEEAVQELSQMLQQMMAEVPLLPQELANPSDQSIAQAFDRFRKACGVGLRHLKLEREGVNVRAHHDRMARLGVALLEYHRKNGRLPGAALSSSEGKPLLSWRVALLPYLGHGDLYKQFHLDEPWDSQHNLALLTRMPAVYASGMEDGAPTTSFQAVTGKGTAFEGKKGRRLHDIKDGPEQTILVAEAERRVPWTKPQDLVYGSDRPLPPLAAGNPAILLADGQVVMLPAPGAVGLAVPRGITESHVRALMTRSSADRAEAAAILSLCIRPHQVTGVEQTGWTDPQPSLRETLPMPRPHYFPATLLPVDGKMPEPLPLPPFTVDQGSAVRQQPGEDQPR
jgi:hypothetical protein